MKKVLIANRGEIACRVIRACRKAGLQTVAIHAAVDAEALHVALADERIEIAGKRPVDAYLDGEAIIAAAKTTSSDAVHLGYGFLAENPSFARSVEAAGLTFVGPRAETIEVMGDKEHARDLARDAGVPVLRGSKRFAVGEILDIAEAADLVGYPLLVKSCAGGGGIGMRVVERPEDLVKTVEATQVLAARSFGDGTIFLERYISKARHVEIQVFGFGDGEAIHLYERECSIQRRFQKIVEESPSLGIDDNVRSAMTASAVAIAKQVRYRGAGTIEFIVDGPTQQFFFLEMNTRIQVEHPVTEMVTGLDLVVMQLELAAGTLDASAYPQDAIRQTGCAIEVRLCAENPARVFLPSPGRLDVLRLADGVEGVRIETGLKEGDSVTIHFDPMIAKIIAYGSQRTETIARLKAALAATDIGSFTSNLPLLGLILAHSAFESGETFTDFLTIHRSDLGL